ncbi:glycosyltransferase [Paenibacillus flagellatus]|uniref:glycosyltransferase n=1 Tax=Paenibacillus flagellatus TaxID=2211139 RepID=UPI00319E338D
MKPAIVFLKGGFVSVPVVLGSRMNKIPVIIHESDMIGLTGKDHVNFPVSTRYGGMKWKLSR